MMQEIIQQVDLLQELFSHGEPLPILQEIKILPEYQIRKIKTVGYVGYLAKHKAGYFRYFKSEEEIEKFHRANITKEYCQVEAS